MASIPLMITSLLRAISVAALGAIAGAASVALAFALNPEFTLEMDRDLPRNVTGFYAPELISSSENFVWTTGRATLSLPGLDRRVPWFCTIRVRGARSAPLPQPTVDISVDGVSGLRRTFSNDYEDVRVDIPRSARPGAVVTIATTPTFTPGPADPRELGVQVDRLQCRPEARSVALPPRRAYKSGMIAGALFGAAFGLIGITAGSAAGAAVLLGVAQGWPLAAGASPYGPYPDRAPWLALWIAASMLAAVTILERHGRTPLRQTAKFAIAFSAGVLYLKLLAIMHPSTPIVDALFQAHRLEWVLAGRYFFTQPMPGGVEFPYAIGLYVFAAPWAALARDHVSLLRIVVCATGAVAGALVYPAIVRSTGDRLAGAIGSALFVAVPASAWVIQNGNLTNAFGGAMACITMALVIIWSSPALRVVHLVMWTAVAALALLSHVSTFATLVVTLGAIAVLFWSFGGAPLRRPAIALMAATLVAVIFAVAIYYGHFGELYVKALHVRDTSVAAAGPPPDVPRPAEPAASYRNQSFAVRAGRSLSLAAQATGWSMLILAVVGGVRLVIRRSTDPLVFALIAWAFTFVLFFAVSVMRVGPAYERYSFEFVGRVVYATYPAAVIAGGWAAAWAWRSGGWLRVASIGLLALAMTEGLRQWMPWR